MFDFRDNKQFKDSVHGYINIPTDFVTYLIDTPEFQRLRGIEQTGLRIVYPSARHDRFSHSIGTFYIGTRIANAFLRNIFFNYKYVWNIKAFNSIDVFWAKNKVLYLIACLLHDIGHAPFSHSTEQLYLYKDNKKAIQEKFNEIFEEDLFEDIKKAQPHEMMSAIIVWEKYKKRIFNLLTKLHEDNYPNSVQLQSEHAPSVFSILGRNDIEEDTTKFLDNDIRFIIRMILGMPYKDNNKKSIDGSKEDYELTSLEKKIRNCFIQLLNGEVLDADKLDYIIRDTKMSGIDNVSIDLDRIIDSITIIPKTRIQIKIDQDLELPNVRIVEIEPNDRITIKGNFDGIIEGKTYGNMIFGEESFIRKFSSRTLTNKTELVLDFDAKIEENGHTFDNSKKGNGKGIGFSHNERAISIENGKVVEFKTDELFFRANDKDVVTVDGDFKNSLITLKDVVDKCSIRCTKIVLSGSGAIEILGVNNLSGYDQELTFDIGYKKGASSVIANILSARNYLYLWAYGHHKVLYCANYIIKEMVMLLEKISKLDLAKTYSFDNSTNINDAYFEKLFYDAANEISIKNDKTNQEERFETLYNEYKSRNYKKSVYKSIPDSHKFFEKIKRSDAFFPDALKKLEKDVMEKHAPDVSVILYGNISIENCEITWVSARMSMKDLNPDKVYFYYENDVIPLSKIQVVSYEYRKSKFEGQFFLYYNSEQLNVEKLKSEIVEWFASP